MFSKIFLVLVLLCSSLNAKDGIVEVLKGSVTLDSSETASIFIGFKGPRGPKVEYDSTRNTDGILDFVRYDPSEFLVYFTLDTSMVTGTSAEIDSFTASGYFLGHDAKRISSQIFFDFANNDTAVAASWTAWTPNNRTGNVAHIWADLITVAQPAFGFEFIVQQAAIDSNGTGSGIITKVTANIPVVR